MSIPGPKAHSLSDEDRRRARVTRDERYDGMFYSAAATTKIYCRPTCPGKPPLETNNIFFENRAQAEEAGFRPCLRCRPELAPDPAPMKTAPWQVRRLLEKIHQGKFTTAHLGEHDQSAHFEAALGVTPNPYWQTYRLRFAKMLLSDTALSLEEISDITRFDTSRKMLVALATLYRRELPKARLPLPVDHHPGLKSCALMLSYRPPFDWPLLLDFFGARTISGVETVANGIYRRSFFLNNTRGWISLQKIPDLNAIRLEVHGTGLGCLMEVVWRVRRMLDLDADPGALGKFFEGDPVLGSAWQRHPGLRVPVCWDAFEFSVRAIVGQLISVQVATKLVGKIVESFGEDLALPAPQGIAKVFPNPVKLQGADLHPCGLTRNKAAAIAGLAQAVVSGTLDLETSSDLDNFIKRCTALKGIGEWTAQTIAMRGLAYLDAFPASDLGIVKGLRAAGYPAKPAQIRKLTEKWRPLRSYAAMLLWMM